MPPKRTQTFEHIYHTAISANNTFPALPAFCIMIHVAVTFHGWVAKVVFFDHKPVEKKYHVLQRIYFHQKLKK